MNSPDFSGAHFIPPPNPPPRDSGNGGGSPSGLPREKTACIVFAVLFFLTFLTAMMAMGSVVIWTGFSKVPLGLSIITLLFGIGLFVRRSMAAGCLTAFLLMVIFFCFICGILINPRYQRIVFPSPDGSIRLAIEEGFDSSPTVYREFGGVFQSYVLHAALPPDPEAISLNWILWIDNHSFVLLYGRDDVWIADLDTKEFRRGTYNQEGEWYTIFPQEGQPFPLYQSTKEYWELRGTVEG